MYFNLIKVNNQQSTFINKSYFCFMLHIELVVKLLNLNTIGTSYTYDCVKSTNMSDQFRCCISQYIISQCVPPNNIVLVRQLQIKPVIRIPLVMQYTIWSCHTRDSSHVYITVRIARLGNPERLFWLNIMLILLLKVHDKQTRHFLCQCYKQFTLTFHESHN